MPNEHFFLKSYLPVVLGTTLTPNEHFFRLNMSRTSYI